MDHSHVSEPSSKDIEVQEEIFIVSNSETSNVVSNDINQISMDSSLPTNKTNIDLLLENIDGAIDCDPAQADEKLSNANTTTSPMAAPTTTISSGDCDESRSQTASNTRHNEGDPNMASFVKKEPENDMFVSHSKTPAGKYYLPKHGPRAPTYKPRTLVWYMANEESRESTVKRAYPALVMNPARNPLRPDNVKSHYLHTWITVLSLGEIVEASNRDVFDFVKFYRQCYPFMAPVKGKCTAELEICKHFVELAALHLDKYAAPDEPNITEKCTDTNWQTFARDKLPFYHELKLSERLYDEFFMRQVRIKMDNQRKFRRHVNQNSYMTLLSKDMSPEPANKKMRFDFPNDDSTPPSLYQNDLLVPLELGWLREVKMRKQPDRKFGDVRYYAPPNWIGLKQCRSMSDIYAILERNPDLCPIGWMNEYENIFSFNDMIKISHKNNIFKTF